MAEANPSLQLRTAVVTFAQQAAMKVIKRQYQARGLKIHQIPRRDYLVAAKEYLREHPEIFAEAAEVVEQRRRQSANLSPPLPYSAL